MSGEIPGPGPNEEVIKAQQASAEIAAAGQVKAAEFIEANRLTDPNEGNNEVKPAEESKFNNMEVAAAASGPEAEARRTELGNWSKAQGALAEAQVDNLKGAEAYNKGTSATPEQTAEHISRTAKYSAEGQYITKPYTRNVRPEGKGDPMSPELYARRDKSLDDVYAKAVDGAIAIAEKGNERNYSTPGTQVLRSPTGISEPKPNPVAASEEAKAA